MSGMVNSVCQVLLESLIKSEPFTVPSCRSIISNPMRFDWEWSGVGETVFSMRTLTTPPCTPARMVTSEDLSPYFRMFVAISDRHTSRTRQGLSPMTSSPRASLSCVGKPCARRVRSIALIAMLGCLACDSGFAKRGSTHCFDQDAYVVNCAAC